MTALAVNRAHSRSEKQAAKEDVRLTVARERLLKFSSRFMALPVSAREVDAAYDGPEVSGSMKSKRRSCAPAGNESRSAA